MKIECEPYLLGRVVGNKWKHINKIKSQVKCNKLFIKHYILSHDSYFYITFPHGCKGNALFAADMLRKRVDEIKLSVDGIQVKCGKHLVGRIVGQRWCNINQFINNSKFNDININYNDKGKYFHVTGNREDSLQVIEFLNKRIAEAKEDVANQSFLKVDRFAAKIDRLRQRNAEDTMSEELKITVPCKEFMKKNIVGRITGKKWCNMKNIIKKCRVKDIRYNNERFYQNIIVDDRLQKQVALNNAHNAKKMLENKIKQVKKDMRQKEKERKQIERNKKEGGNGMKKSFSSASLSTISSTESNSDQRV